MNSKFARREFLKRASAVSVTGAAAPWALNLAAIGEAAAQQATDYKALVCVFLLGGNDYGNTVIPYDTANHTIYTSLRGGLQSAGGLAFAKDSVLDLNLMTPNLALPSAYAGMQFALSPYTNPASPMNRVNPLLPVFNAGRFGVLFNVGTLRQPTTKAQYSARSVPLPPKLFSHNDQQSFWQSNFAEGAKIGWGGRMGDLFASGNGKSVFTSISVSGNAVYLAGNSSVQYQVSTTGAVAISGVKNNLFGSSQARDALRTLLTTVPAGQGSAQLMTNDLVNLTSRSISAEADIAGGLAANTGAYTTVQDNSNSLMSQLKMVARIIQSRGTAGAKRQVFFVSLGGFDTHDAVITSHPTLMQRVADAMVYFDSVLGEIGARDMVTTFTASDFGRTMTGNGNGSDHGWGSHHFVMGGAVNGGRFYGKPPVLDATASKTSTGGADDVGQGRLFPSTSVDQYAATLATWFGVSATDMPLVLPQIGEWGLSDGNLGFMK